MTPAEVARRAIATVVLGQVGRRWIEVATARLEEIDINEMTWDQLITVLELGIKLERLSAGLPTEIIEIRGLDEH